MKFHFYGQPYFIELPKGTIVEDLKTLAWFNRIIKNKPKMDKIVGLTGGNSSFKK